jgi:hypothetical protein
MPSQENNQDFGSRQKAIPARRFGDKQDKRNI